MKIRRNRHYRKVSYLQSRNTQPLCRHPFWEHFRARESAAADCRRLCFSAACCRAFANAKALLFLGGYDDLFKGYLHFASDEEAKRAYRRRNRAFSQTVGLYTRAGYGNKSTSGALAESARKSGAERKKKGRVMK